MKIYPIAFLLMMIGHLSFSQVVPIDSSGVYAPVDQNSSSKTMTKANGLTEDLIFQHDENWVKIEFNRPLIESSNVYAPLNIANSSRKMTKALSLKEDLIFQHDENWVKLVRTDGYTAMRKSLEGQDFMHYIPDATNPNTRGTLVINHEIFTSMETDTILGFGSGMSIVKVEKIGDTWSIMNDPILGDTSIAVDFSPVGFTTSNCGGAVLPNGNVISGEEIFSQFNVNNSTIDPVSNIRLVLENGGRFGYDATDSTYTIPASYPEFGGMKIPFDANFGWMTEVNPATAKATMKHYHMGRFSHEGGVVLNDNRTVILTDDFVGAGLFKFVADVPGDFTAGNLYAFKQDAGSYSGSWVQIDRNIDSLIHARDVAARKGATMFMRLEWTSVDPETGDVYISETGRDITSNQNDLINSLNRGANIPYHWTNDVTPGDSVFYDATLRKVDLPYGTVLKLTGATTNTPKVTPFLRGGFNSTKTFCFNSVDGQTVVNINDKKYLVFTEDNIGRSRGRISPNFVGSYPYEYPKAFLLDLSIENPTKDDLKLVTVGSRDSELTGAVFTPDGNTMFIVNQHPSLDDNLPPYHKAAVFAYSGFKNGITTAVNDFPNSKESKQILGYPNPVVNEIRFNESISGKVFNMSGQLVFKFENRDFINVTNFTTGTYILISEDGRSMKFIVQ